MGGKKSFDCLIPPHMTWPNDFILPRFLILGSPGQKRGERVYTYTTVVVRV